MRLGWPGASYHSCGLAPAILANIGRAKKFQPGVEKVCEKLVAVWALGSSLPLLKGQAVVPTALMGVVGVPNDTPVRT